MTTEVKFSRLAHEVARLLGVPFSRRIDPEDAPFGVSPADIPLYSLTFDWSNHLEVSTSFDGRFSSPYAGQVRLDPAAPETKSLSHDFWSFLTTSAGLELSPPDDFPLISAIVSFDEVGDLFLEVLADLTGEEKSLEAVLKTLQEEVGKAKTEDLSQKERDMVLRGVDAWRHADAERQRQLNLILLKLAEDDVLRFAAKRRLREYKWKYVIHDHRHYLLFGQNEEHITPKSWFDAAWRFVQHFRCNFGMFITEAMLYENVTIVGADDATVPVSRQDQWFLEEYTGYVVKEDGSKKRRRRVERLNVVNAQQLSDLLKDRIMRGARFEGGEISPLN